MSEGKTFQSFSTHLGIGVGALDRWVKKYPEFKRAKDMAKMASLSMWEQVAIDQASGKSKGNSNTLIFYLKNRFSDFYKDKQEIEHKGDLNFMVNTGIDRSLDEGEYSGKEVREIEIDEVRDIPILEVERDLL